MSTTNVVTTITKLASADLSTAQYKFGVVNGSNRIAVAGAGVRVDGVIANNSANAADKPVEFQIDGVVKVKANGVINPGGTVASDGGGLAVASQAGDVVAGVYQGETAAAANDIIPVLLRIYKI